jgi:hypothetical protein
MRALAPAHRLEIAGAGDPDDQGREQQRPDDHLDHPQEEVGERAEVARERRPEPADHDPQHEPDQDARGRARDQARRRAGRGRERSGDAAG